LPFFILLSGCATVNSPLERAATADFLAESAGFKKEIIKTKDFMLLSYCRFKKEGNELDIYIEGDGHAWTSRGQLSNDPTPEDPVALELATVDPQANVAYLARPGQYQHAGIPGCDSAYWSVKRFSEEVIIFMNEAVEELRARAKADKVNLIGYSGGGAIAVLIAARRNDVISLRTVGGNLDSEALSRYYHISPLTGSLNPIEAAEKLKNLPQRHFIGSDDKIIPKFIVESFIRRTGDENLSRMTIVEGATHTKGWKGRWKSLLLNKNN